MDLEQAKKAVEELIAAVYPVSMQKSIMDAFLKAPNAAESAYWENIRLGLAQAGQPQESKPQVSKPAAVKKETSNSDKPAGKPVGESGPENAGEKDFEVSPSKDGKSVIVTGYKVTRWKDQVQIPAIINGKPVTGIADKAFYNKGAKNMIIPDSVTGIGDSAFEKSKLASINIPQGVALIGKRAFAECRDLAAIVIPDSVTGIGDEAFEGCSRLANVTLGKGITSIGKKTFKRCELSKGIIIPDSVTGIGEEAFFQSKLASVSIGKGVASIGNEAFAQCNISSVTFSGIVKAIGEEAFADNKTVEGDFMVEYSNDASSIIITGYERKGKSINFPARIRGLPVSRIKWSAIDQNITGVTIPGNVTMGGGSGVSHPSIVQTINIGSNVKIEGNNFDRINAEKLKEFSPHPTLFVPLHKLYEQNGRKAGTFTLIMDKENAKVKMPERGGAELHKSGNGYWGFKERKD